MTLILSGTDGVSDIDGTAATPAIRGTDANTGIFFPAADTIAFAEGGVEAARIDSSGNVGIGVTPSTRLTISGANTASRGQISVVGAGVDPRQTFYSDSTFTGAMEFGTALAYIGSVANVPFAFYTNNTERMRIDSSGGVITYPAANGHAIFNENSADADFRVESDTNTNALFVDAGTSRVSINVGSSPTNVALNVEGGTVRSNQSNNISTTGGVASNIIATSTVISSTSPALASAIVLIAVSGSNSSDGGFNGYYLLHLNKNFGNYVVTVISSGLPHNNTGYSFTWTLDANNLMVTPGKTTSLNYTMFILCGPTTA